MMPAADICAARLSSRDWRARRARHEERVDAWIVPHLDRASRGERHPVFDFLFEYYSHRPAHLRRWHPGVGLVLEDAEDFAVRPPYARHDGDVFVSLASLTPDRRRSIQWIAALLRSVDQRAPFFGCAGLHEWAMVYRADTVRHSDWPLRLSPQDIAAVVEAAPIRCSHHDAFRFFTEAARPLNRLQPTRSAQPDLEQPGCLHANMDLYKWACKLTPLAPSELVADAFSLAREIREIDMRASPYDFSDLGFTPIPIETSEGRRIYETYQRDFASRARPIRRELLRICDYILGFEL